MFWLLVFIFLLGATAGCVLTQIARRNGKDLRHVQMSAIEGKGDSLGHGKKPIHEIP
jgi:hypothetical protein